MRKTMRCGSILIRADEVLFAIANTGDTSEVFLRNGRSIIVKMCLAEFEVVWNNALNEIGPDSNKPLRNCDVGSVEEQTMRMRAHCNKCKPDCKDSLGNRCKCYGDVSKENCFLKWAQMPYEGGNDGIK